MYRSAGWHGVLPIGRAPGKKYPPPSAFTGHGKPDPSGADTEAWLMGPEQAFNIGLRLPAGVLGIDVDAYGGKQGGQVFTELQQRYGPLPPTWITSARTDGVSGIRLFRVPLTIDGHDVNWPGEAGKHIELIQHGHRYAVVWPSTNPEAAGAQYEWRFQHPDGIQGQPAPSPPSPGTLPWLPEPWVRGLMLPYARTDKATLGGDDLAAYWEGLRPGERCPTVQNVLTRALAELAATDGSRHETARDAVRALVALGGEGHRGVPAAVEQVSRVFAEAVGPERVGNGEWHRLLVGGIRLAAAKDPAPRQSCPDDPATAVPADLIPADFSVPALATASPATVTVDVPAGTLTLPDEFWAARSSLGRIRQAAHSRVRSADVVFYGTLVRIAAMAPYRLRAETGVGTAASLNLFAAIVGPSGGGKSSGLSVGRKLVKDTRHLEEFPLGSGEGVAEAYMGDVMKPTGEMAKDGSEKLAKVRDMVRHNVLFHSDEGNTLNKLIERAGSTVGETLRSAWSGETIGQKNGRAETTRTVSSGQYSAGVIIGYQPSTVLPLLDDHEAGTPQRFLFCWAVDGSIPGRHERVLWPGEMLSPFPEAVPTSLPGPDAIIAAPPPPMVGETIVFAEEIADELYDTEHAKNTGALPADHPLRDPFRSQHPVLKIKVASLLALIEGRRNVNAEDWRLAQIVLDTSDTVRIYLQGLAAGKAAAAREAAERTEHALEWHREHARTSVREASAAAADGRLAARVANWVHDDGPATLGALRKRSAGRDRPAVESAIELAVGYGWLAYGGAEGRIHPGASRPSTS